MTLSADPAAIDRPACVAFDAEDPLAWCRDRFTIPEGVIYLDGNSLGALPAAAPARLRQVVEQEWGMDLIRAWNRRGWLESSIRVGARIGRLVGAREGEVVVCDSTSVNLFKLIIAGLRLRPGRHVILSEPGNFPSDLYVASGAAELMGAELRLVEAARLPAALDQEVALLCLTHVDYRSGRIHDMAGLTQAAHAAGALALWDLSHTAGAMPCDLAGSQVDLAVGCGYKYLNGGPGAPAYAFVAQPLWSRLQQPVTGWLGHARPFDFDLDYQPADGPRRLISGTPPVLSMLALEVGVDTFEGVDLAQLRRKSKALTELFLRLAGQRLAGHGFQVACPADAEQRGSQVSFAHPNGYSIMQALISRGVIGDFRAPDLLRFGVAPLYTRYVDVYDAVSALADIMASGEWRDPRFQVRATVT